MICNSTFPNHSLKYHPKHMIHTNNWSFSDMIQKCNYCFKQTKSVELNSPWLGNSLFRAEILEASAKNIDRRWI